MSATKAATSGDVPGRARGGYRDLNTIPSNVTHLCLQDVGSYKALKLVANYVAVSGRPQIVMHMYRVDIEPVVESEEHRRRLFREASKKFFKRVPTFDGGFEARSREKLGEESQETEVASNFGGTAETFKVKFAHTGEASTEAEMIRTYNLELRGFLRKLGYFQPQMGLHVHQNFTTRIGNDIAMVRGFRTSTNFHEGNKVLVNLEGSHKLMQTRNVLDIMNEIRQRSQGDFKEPIRAALIGKLVITSYKKVAYRIEDVDFDSNPTNKFTLHDGTETSISDYLKNKHNVTVNNLKQPLLTAVLNSERRRTGAESMREAKLIPELCNIAGLTESQRNDTWLKNKLLEASQVAPKDRVEHLRAFLNTFHADSEIAVRLAEERYNYAKEPLKLTGHHLPSTKLVLRPDQVDGRSPMTDNNNPNATDFRCESLAVAPKISRMAIIHCQNPAHVKSQIIKMLQHGFNTVGMTPEAVDQFDVENDSPAGFTRALRSLKPPLTLALVIMRNQNKAIYDSIKKLASNEMGLVTQVVTSRLMTNEKKASSASIKIAIQIAAKVGGEPWWTDMPLKSSMVCGYDAHHDTTARGRSFGAFVASLNDRHSRWFSKADQHDRLSEISTQMATNVLEALDSYKKINGKFPERVFIYRDGVGEGQIGEVFETELNVVKERIKSVHKSIRLTMIIVNKRIGARFFLDVGNSFVNPPPGTVVDRTVTRPNRFDFYLISQTTRHGTISPTYYNIIYDENAFAPEIHQKMAYKFCMLYYNWTGSVRVPAPCQYAHKLAYLCGEHLHAAPNANLSNKLHFL